MEDMRYERFWRDHLGEGKPEGKEFMALCPACGGNRFSADMESGRFNCWHCRKTGNYVSYLKIINPQLTDLDLEGLLNNYGIHREMSQGRVRKAFECPEGEIAKNEARLSPEALEGLSKERGISPGIFKKHRLGMNEAGEYVLPIYDMSGRVTDLRRRSRSCKGEKASTGATIGIFGIIHAHCHPMILCESPMDALASEEMGFPAMGLCGAGQKIGRHLDLFKGRDLILAFDNDDAGRDGMRRVIDELKGVVHSVRILEIPSKDGIKDVNDMLFKGLRVDYVSMMTALIDAITANGNEAVTSQKTDAANLSDAKGRQFQRNSTYIDAADAMVEGFKRGGKLCLRYWRGEFYEFEGVSYRVMKKDDLKVHINRFLMRYEATRTWVGWRPVDAIVEGLKALTRIDARKMAPCWIEGVEEGQYVTMQNGIFDLGGITTGGMKVEGHSPDFFDLVSLPYGFEPEAKAPRWEVFMQETFPDASVRMVIQEWFGYCLDIKLNFQRCLIMEGPGQNGKGVVSEILRAMLGPENVSSVGLERFGDKFSLLGTLHKAANIVGDLEQLDKMSEGKFKEFVAQDPMQFERKFGDSFTAKPTAKLIFSTNELPRVRDKTMGVWRRLHLVKCLNVVPQERRIANLAEQLMSELPGIFNWALEGLLRLYIQGDFSKSEAISAWVREYQAEQNPARIFLTDRYEEAPLGEEVSGEVYTAYVEWCESNGYQGLNEVNFSKEVYRTFPRVSKKQRRSSGDRWYVFAGLQRVV